MRTVFIQKQEQDPNPRRAGGKTIKDKLKGKQRTRGKKDKPFNHLN